MDENYSIFNNPQKICIGYKFIRCLSEYSRCRIFKRIVDSGNFVFVNDLLVINDAKYVTRNEQGQLCLTEYARNNQDECTLIAENDDKHKVVVKRGKQSKIRKHGIYKRNLRYEQLKLEQLAKQDSPGLTSDSHAENGLEGNYQPKPSTITIQNVEVFERSEELKRLRYEIAEDITFITETKQNFSQLAWKLMEHCHCNYKELFREKTLLSDRTFDRIKAGKLLNPDIETAIAICAGLNLGVLYGVPSLKSAGIDLEQSSVPLHRV